MSFTPPKISQKFLHWFCREELVEQVEGDIIEECDELQKQGLTKEARNHYTTSAVRFFRPFAFKKLKINQNMGLAGNYLKVSIRNLNKDKQTTAIGYLSLFLGFLSVLMIVQVVLYETGYDSWHENKDRIYRVTLEITEDGRVRNAANVGPPVAPAIEKKYPEVEKATRFRYMSTTIVSTADRNKAFYEDKVFYTDPQTFKIFSFPFDKGDPEIVFDSKNNVVLTYEMARKYFGNEDPIGKRLQFGELGTFIVSGVLSKLPPNNHLDFDFLLPFEAFEVPFGYPVTLQDWRWSSFHTYILLDKNARLEELQSKMPEFSASHFAPDIADRFSYFLQPLESIYLGDIEHEAVAKGSSSNVYILVSVGLLILSLCTFNFTNISTAQSLTRNKETGIRKALGSTKSSLIKRYLSEPLVISILAAATAIFVCWPASGALHEFFNFPDYRSPSDWWVIVPAILLVAIVVSVLAGAYPAFILSRKNAREGLKNETTSSRKSFWFRYSLVALQFFITVFLIASGIVVSRQLSFMQTKDLGFEKDYLSVLRIPGELLDTKFDVLKNELLKHNNIKEVAVGGGRLDGDTGNVPIQAKGHDPVNLPITGGKDNFFTTLGVKFISGRDFSEKFISDSTEAIIVNEAFVKKMGWTAEEAIGQSLAVGAIMRGRIIGVTENFHFESLRKEVQPIVTYYPRTMVQDVFIRASAGNPLEMVNYLDQTVHETMGDIPFDFVFMDQYLNKLYTPDQQFAYLVQLFSVITIFIALIGLFGLISLICKQKIKEIGIRKVLGASEKTLVLMFSRSFILTILASSILAFPITYFSSSAWLSNFAYRVDVNWLYFGLVLLFITLISFVTLYIKIKTYAAKNPVYALRDE